MYTHCKIEILYLLNCLLCSKDEEIGAKLTTKYDVLSGKEDVAKYLDARQN
jgi:hypothetical protein